MHGDFVKFLNKAGEFEQGTDTELKSTNNLAKNICAVALSENKVLVLHSYGSTNYLYAVVCTIDGYNITVGTDTYISKSSNTGTYFSAAPLDSSRVAIVFYYSTITAVICTIDGDTIKMGNFTKVLYSISVPKLAIEVLDENKLLITRSLQINVVSVVCTIEEDRIIVGTENTLIDTGTIKELGGTIKLNKNKLVLLYGNEDYNLCAVLCTIDGTNIVPIKNTLLSRIALLTNGAISAAALSENKIIITYSGGVDDYLYGMICTIADDKIVKETETRLSRTTYTAQAVSAVKLSENVVVIAHSYSSDRFLCVTIVEIDNNIITVKNTTPLNSIQGSAYVISASLIGTNVFIAHNSNTDTYKLYGMVIEQILIPEVQKVMSEEDIIGGISKNKAIDGQEVKVVRPNYNESEEN